MRPLSGWKLASGSSEVMRAWMAKPRGWTPSWVSPRSAREAPAAILICDCTMSTPVTSSVTVCSTCTRGFTSRK